LAQKTKNIYIIDDRTVKINLIGLGTVALSADFGFRYKQGIKCVSAKDIYMNSDYFTICSELDFRLNNTQDMGYF